MVVGLPVKVNHNLDVEKGILNGTNSRIVGAEFNNDIEFEKSDLGGVQFFIANEPPSAVFVDIPGYERFNWDKLGYRFPSSVVPISKLKKGLNVRLPNRNFTVTVSQIPLSISVAATF